MALIDEAQSLWAKIQAFAANFLLTDQQLLEARRNLSALRDASLSTGSVKTAQGNILSTAQIDDLLAQNSELYNEGQGLKARFAELASQYEGIRSAVTEAAGSAAETLPEIPGMLMEDSGIGIAPAFVTIGVWVTAAGLLYFAISKFMGKVKDHINAAAGSVGGFIFSTWMILALGGLAYLLWGRK